MTEQEHAEIEHPDITSGTIFGDGEDHTVNVRKARDEEFDVWIEASDDLEWLFLDETGYPREPVIRNAGDQKFNFKLRPETVVHDSMNAGMIKIGGFSTPSLSLDR